MNLVFRLPKELPTSALQTICLVVLLGLSSGVARGGQIDDKDIPVFHDRRPKFILFSWTTHKHVRRFELVADRDGSQEHRFIDNFNLRQTPGMSLPDLKQKFAKLPRGCLVTWMRDDVHKFDHATRQVVRQLRHSARRNGIDLRLDVYLYDAPDA